MITETITWQDFEKIQILVGTIIEVKDFEKAKKPAYQVQVNFGDIGTRWSSAQITLYKKEELLGKQVICVVNFPKKQIANFFSECLITGFPQEDGSVVIAQPERVVKNGLRLA